MAGITSFLNGSTFSSELTQLMRDAYERATKGLHDTGQPAMVQEIIAKRIIDLATSGERDPQKMAQSALESLGIKSRD